MGTRTEDNNATRCHVDICERSVPSPEMARWQWRKPIYILKNKKTKKKEKERKGKTGAMKVDNKPHRPNAQRLALPQESKAPLPRRKQAPSCCSSACALYPCLAHPYGSLIWMPYCDDLTSPIVIIIIIIIGI